MNKSYNTKAYNTKACSACIECGKLAKWERNTQFSGSHPYCKKHAKLESDFKKDNSYQFWIRVNRK